MKIALAAEIMTPIQQIHEEIAETDNEKRSLKNLSLQRANA